MKTYLLSLVMLGALDFVWLGIVAKKFNTEQLAPIARMKGGAIDLLKLPALLAYLVMAMALTLFAAPKATPESLLLSFAWGAGLGFVIYAIFDLTNYAILRAYPLAFALADVAWGTFLFGVATTGLALAKDYLN